MPARIRIAAAPGDIVWHHWSRSVCAGQCDGSGKIDPLDGAPAPPACAPAASVAAAALEVTPKRCRNVELVSNVVIMSPLVSRLRRCGRGRLSPRVGRDLPLHQRAKDDEPAE